MVILNLFSGPLCPFWPSCILICAHDDDLLQETREILTVLGRMPKVSSAASEAGEDEGRVLALEADDIHIAGGKSDKG